MEFIAKVQKQGRIALPKSIREIYRIKAGDKLRLELLEVFREYEQEGEKENEATFVRRESGKSCRNVENIS